MWIPEERPRKSTVYDVQQLVSGSQGEDSFSEAKSADDYERRVNKSVKVTHVDPS